MKKQDYMTTILVRVQFEYRILILSGFLMARWIFNEWASEYGMPFLVTMISCYLLVMTPVILSIKRRSQLEADMYTLNTGRKPDLFISSVIKSAGREKADPGF